MSAGVLVVGAGPVGLTMALALKRRGVPLRIVDRAAAPSDKSKALVLWPRTLELLDIEGCVQPFLDLGERTFGARIMADGKSLVHIDFAAARSQYRFALMIPQCDTERLLQEQLTALGVEVERGVELTTFSDDGLRIAAALRHADGHGETLVATHLVGCDGAHSTIRHGLGVHFDGDTLPSDWLLADVDIAGSVPRDELTICWTADGVLALFPIRGARFRIIGDLGAAPAGGRPAPTLGDVQTLLDQRGPAGLTLHDPTWINHFSINERKVKDYARGRIFLAGDAAHVHSPAGGQGMNTGMQDAFNLAWKLALVTQHGASPALLDSYSPERSAVGDQVLRNAGNMTKIAILRNPVLQEIRSLAVGALGRLPPLRQHLVDQLTEVDLSYRDSPLSSTPRGAARHPAGGERAPDLPLLDNAGTPLRLHELLRPGKFAVLSVDAAPVQLPGPLREIATPAAVGAAPPYASGHCYLIRPDAYVMMSTPGNHPAAIFEALDRLGKAAPDAVH